MADLGAMLVSSAPVGPGERAGEGACGFDDQDGEQSADLVAGQRDQPAIGWKLIGLGGEDGEQGVGDHREQGPAPPGGVQGRTWCSSSLCWPWWAARSGLKMGSGCPLTPLLYGPIEVVV